MLRRYELTDQEWEQVASLLPQKKRENRDGLQRITVPCLTGWSGLLAAVPPDVTFRNAMALGIRYTAASASGLTTVCLIIFSGCSAWKPNFMSFHWMPRLSRPISTVPEQKRGPPNGIGHSRGGASSKIHAAADIYGYPVCLMLIAIQ
mgnify:CR=1 FL=1